MPVVTIARQYGAGGESVGQMVAKKLKADLLDKQIVIEVARRSKLPHAEVEAQTEQPGGFLNRLLVALGSANFESSVPSEVAAWTPPYHDPSLDPRSTVLEMTQQVVREAARGGNVVIVGHGAGYLLHDLAGALHVFLQAPIEARLKSVMELFSVSEEEARKRIKHTDENRAAYIKQIYGHTWTNPSHYHLVLDTDRFGYEGTANVIVAAAAIKTKVRLTS